ncbi:MAG: 5-(carboxyamino)imidazole ribonucleotide mutase [Candidatus Saccharibacteria bacterium]
MSLPKVAIMMGSDSDLQVMKDAADILKKFGVEYEVAILSAHRVPRDTAAFADSAEERGLQVIIAGAGGAAHLAGVVAAHTTVPVIGVPIMSKTLSGVDSLYSIVQMPKGIPVATVAINGAANAALLAIQILAISDPELRTKINDYRNRLAEEVRVKRNRLNDLGIEGYLLQKGGK